MTKLVSVTIDGRTIEVPEGIPVIEAARKAGVEVPRFCYHPKLEIAGNCRMCLVEVEGQGKLAASCALPAAPNMVVHTKNERVRQAREGVLEFLLINHPLDCPICDQGGECDLQDLTMEYGRDRGRFTEDKRAVTNKNLGPLIKTEMTRCIHCMRCVRFAQDIAGVPELGAYGRGEDAEIVTYLDKAVSSELSGNNIDLCPVGALTSKPYAFRGRPWELTKTITIDILDAMCTPIRVDSYGDEVKRVLPATKDETVESWITDKARFSYDGLHYQRIDNPYTLSKSGLSVSSWSTALELIARKLKAAKRQKKVAALAGPLSDVESMYVIKRIMKELETKQFDCRGVNNHVSAKHLSHALCNTTYKGILKADVILVVGEGLRRLSPLLHARLRKAHRDHGTKVYYIGPKMDEKWDLTFPYTHIDEDVAVLKKIAAGRHAFAKKLAEAKNPAIFVSETVLANDLTYALQNVAHKIATRYCSREIDGNAVTNYNLVTSSAAQTGGLALGFGGTPKADTGAIIAAAEQGELDVLILNEFDECIIRPHAKCFVIYVGHHGDRGAEIANVVLPSFAYTEKTATYVNMFGEIRRTRRAVSGPENALEGWEIWNKILRHISGEGYGSHEELFADIQKEHSFFDGQEILWTPLDLKAPRDFPETPEPGYLSYYLDNVISRNSRTMRACYNEIECGQCDDKEERHA